jgi:hypothetical protein
MSEYLKKFSVSDVQMSREQNEDLDFAIVEVWALSEGTNSHRNPFTREVLERDADTFKGKFIVAKYDKFTQDVKAHEVDESIVGYIPPNETINFKTKLVDGIEKEFVVIKALLSKIYAKEVVDMFKTDNQRTVSCEFSCSTQYEEDEYGRALDENGTAMDIENPILAYHIHSICILGKQFNPSVKATEIKVKQFAKSFEEQPTLRQLAEERTNKLKSISMQKKFEQNKEDKEDNMEETKNLSESESKDTEKDVVMEEDKALVKQESNQEEQPKEDTEKEMGCGDSKEMSDEESKEDEAQEETKEDKETEKKFSLDAYVDQVAMSIMLENETETSKQLADQVMKEMSANEIVEKFIQMSKENADLMADKVANDNEKRDKKFASIMASVKEDLDTKQFSELSEEGKTLSLEQLGAFENKVKAFAYEATKNNKTINEDDGIMRFGGVDDTLNKQDSDDVFVRLSQM